MPMFYGAEFSEGKGDLISRAALFARDLKVRRNFSVFLSFWTPLKKSK